MLRIMFLAVILTACSRGEQVNSAPTAGDTIHLPPIEWRIVSQRELRDAYMRAGMTLEDGQVLHGFAATQGGMHIVYTLPPRVVDDQATLTLGHEVMHVAIGSYHK